MIGETTKKEQKSTVFPNNYKVVCNQATECRNLECTHRVVHESNAKKARGWCEIYKKKVRCVLA